MKTLVYLGPADIRILSAQDYEKMGLDVGSDFSPESFYRGVPFETEDETAAIMLSSPLLPGEFGEYNADMHSSLAKPQLGENAHVTGELVDTDDGDIEEDYELYKVPELEELIAKRNETREEDLQIMPASKLKADLISALEADDKSSADSGSA